MRFEELPAEIRLSIYKFVFDNVSVCPSPILYARHPQCEKYERKKFEEMQATEPEPIGILVASKFFYCEALLRQAFYSTVTFNFNLTWHWSAFQNFMRQKNVNKDSPTRLITAVADFGSPYCYWHLDIDGITTDLLPNLKNVHLTLFGKQLGLDGRVISNVYEYGDFDRINCNRCGPPSISSSRTRPERVYCHDHSAATPSRLSLRAPHARFQRSWFDVDMIVMGHDCHPASEYVLVNFFNDFEPFFNEYRTGLDEYALQCRQGRVLKDRILQGDVKMRLRWKMIFGDTRLDPSSDSWEVYAHFSSADWTLRYTWQGKDYEILQSKPTHFDEDAERYVVDSHKQRDIDLVI